MRLCCKTRFRASSRRVLRRSASGCSLKLQSSESGKCDAKTDLRERDHIVQEKLAWDENAAHQIWCFGCETEGVKVLVKDVPVPQITEMIQLVPPEHIQERIAGEIVDAPVPQLSDDVQWT